MYYGNKRKNLQRNGNQWIFAILFNLVMLPALAFLNFYLLEEVVWLAVPILLVLILAFVLMLPGYFSQEPNEARVMVFFGKYEGTFKRTGFTG